MARKPDFLLREIKGKMLKIPYRYDETLRYV